jgi:hypothetical protein
VSGGDELVAAADAEVQVTRGLFREGEAEGFCFLLGCHDEDEKNRGWDGRAVNTGFQSLFHLRFAGR